MSGSTKMAGLGAEVRTLDEMLKESREKRKAEQLAQEIFGKRPKMPASVRSKQILGGSLASRVGVSKRPSSLPRTNSVHSRNARTPLALLNRPAGREDISNINNSNNNNNNSNNQRNRQPYNQPPSPGPVPDVKSNGYSGYESSVANGGGPGVSIRGAASGPHVVIASNFAPGTTAADIESVMLDVGGQMTDCRLLAIHPTVVAEMTFVEKSGAETVINTFHNKKADGRTLHVYWKNSTPAHRGAELEVPVEVVEEAMEVDENAQSREMENRLREERRGRPERDPRTVFPAGPKADRGGYDDDYYRGPRPAEAAYQDGRYGMGRNERYGGPRPRYRDEGRIYTDDMRRGGGPQTWRPQ